MSAKPFVIPDFTVSTSCAVVLHVTTNGSISEVLLHEHDTAINALAAHPSLPHLLIGSYSCKLKLWNYETKWATNIPLLAAYVFWACQTKPYGSYNMREYV